jgi:two-component system, cell cycle sensor histidine kinase and response regulator CckA
VLVWTGGDGGLFSSRLNLSGRPLPRYGVALIAVIAGVLLHTALNPIVASRAPMLIFVLPTLVSSWYGGFGPGLAATLAGGSIALTRLRHQGPLDSNDFIVFAIFIVVGITISLLNERLHRVAAQAEADAAGARQHEDALRASEERYRLLADSMHDVVTLLEPDGRVLFISPSVTDRLGWEVEDVIGHNAFEYVHPDDRRRLEPSLRPPAGAAAGAIAWRCRCRDRSWRWLETNVTVLAEDASGRRRVLWTSRDVTDRKGLEDQLRQAQKMEAIGRLAGGVAHDFNNVLTVILGYASNLEYTVDPDDAIAPQVAEIRVAAERAARLTQQLLAFSRQQVLQPRVLDINAIVRQQGTSLQRMIGTHVVLEADLDPGVWPVLVDPGQVEQIFMNLVANARDATPAGGTVTIRTRRSSNRAPRQEQGVPMPAGDWVLFEVIDTGSGMPPTVAARIFEPFFTTKPVGQGTGLGLSMVYGIIKQSGGYVFCESAPGQGTTLRVYLPRAISAMETSVGARKLDIAGTGTVLVVEDEPAVRTLIVSVLRGQGLQVLEAGSGREALAVLDGHTSGIDLLITDVIMPEMTGVEVARRVHAEMPRVPVLYMSGYTDDVLLHEHAVPGAAFLQKPFPPDVLLRRVKQMLEPAAV